MDEKNTDRTVVTDKSSNTFMPFVVGALVVAVGVLAWFFFAGPGTDGGTSDVNVTIDRPAGDGDGGGSGAQGGGSAGGGADTGGGSGGGSGGNSN